MANETENAEALLSNLPLKRTWLDAIVDVFFHRPEGIAEIGAVTNEILKTHRNAGKETEATVTRTINNYCENAQDTKKKVKHPIFRRIAPGTYRLLTHPKRPNLIDIQKIKFDDIAYGRVWEDFQKHVVKKLPKKWDGMSNSEKLTVFAQSMRNSQALKEMLEIYRDQEKTITPLPHIDW